MNSISLVISDVDGSSLTPDKRLTEAAIQAVKRLAERDIGFTITSSHPPLGMRMLIEPLNIQLRARAPAARRRRRRARPRPPAAPAAAAPRAAHSTAV